MGATLEVEFASARGIGADILNTARARSEFRVVQDRPNILFLEPEKFFREYVDALNYKGKIGPESIEEARKASLGLSVEAALQIIEAKSYKKQFVEDTESLADINRMLGRSVKFVENISLNEPDLLIAVVGEISKRRGSEIFAGETAIAWANENLVKAKQRIDKKIEAIEAIDRGY
ncbi:MAG: hypothetical protein UU16_C0028G0007 [Candidatus Woesebacteria bacterium GW2011_GWA2_40_7]|nr:MAG: hypothetical protein UU16_C0028G0007 [Candidatus Woesebacteria bacterium GW2011_GWA2_40_7]